MNNNIIFDCVMLSSGTLSNLTGIKDVVKLDEILNRFVDFVVSSDKKYNTWIEAWNIFNN